MEDGRGNEGCVVDSEDAVEGVTAADESIVDAKAESDGDANEVVAAVPDTTADSDNEAAEAVSVDSNTNEES